MPFFIPQPSCCLAAAFISVVVFEVFFNGFKAGIAFKVPGFIYYSYIKLDVMKRQAYLKHYCDGVVSFHKEQGHNYQLR